MPEVTYELYSRGKVRTGKKRPRLEFIEAVRPSRWQFLVKLAAKLAAKGHKDVVIKQITVTHEQRFE